MLTTVYYCCLAFSGLIAILMLLLLWRSHFFLTPASHNAALCDLLDYATLADENVIVLKSGALLSLYACLISRSCQTTRSPIFTTSAKRLCSS